MTGEKTAAFLEEAQSIHWFENSGSPSPKYRMVFSLYEACDTWGKAYMEVWEPHICGLEDIAAERIGDDAVDEIFDAVSAAIGDTVWEKFGGFIERRRPGRGAGGLL